MSTELIGYTISLCILVAMAIFGLEASRLLSRKSLPLGLLMITLTTYFLYTSYDILREALNPVLAENEKSMQILVALLLVFSLMISVAMWIGIKLSLTYSLGEAKKVGYALIISLTIALLFVWMMPYIGIQMKPL